MRIAIVQINSGDDIDRNLHKVEAYVCSAAEQGARMIFLPECFALMQSGRAQLRSAAEEEGSGKIQDFLSRISVQRNVWIFAGSLPLKTDAPSLVANSLLVYDDRGERVARYDKIHLFDVVLSAEEKYLESAYTKPGASVQVIDTPAGRTGLSICYDLRFPEMYRKLSEMGAEILVVPSAFSYTTGQSHWSPLLTARAVENTCYVIAPAQVGLHAGDRRTYGHSLAIDPWGNKILEVEEQCGAFIAEIDLFALHRIRKKMPSLSHRQPQLF